MFRKTLIATVAITGIMSTASVFAEAIPVPNDFGGGTMYLHGKVIDSPCSIDSKHSDMDVDLGQASLKHLNAVAGNGGKLEPIVIQLDDCAFEAGTSGDSAKLGLLSKVDVTFDGFTSSDAKNGLVNNTAPGDMAKNVAIKLLRDATTPFDLTSGATSVGTQLVPGNGNQLTLYAQMVSTSTSATKGAVSAHINYKLKYF
ncbi:hypothetical protein LE36_07785 [Salmonella enterica subsp. diarizonae]|nr:hypothetical protein [Salmonella enterica subsp. diarizonae]